MSNYRPISFAFCLLLLWQVVCAQDISFFHLSKKEGLSDNQVTAVVMDKNGMLWVGTSEGLNCYDGYTVKKFYKEEFPSLQNNDILRMTCDEKNRIWIFFADRQITLLDESRKFHAVRIIEKGIKIMPDYLLPNTSRGVLFLSKGHLYHPDTQNPFQFKRIKWSGDTALHHNFTRINEWNKDKLICTGDNRLIVFDVTQLKIDYSMPLPNVFAAARLNDQEAIITTTDNDKVCRVNLLQKKIVQKYNNLKDQYRENIYPLPRSICHLQNNEFMFTSAYAGIYVLDIDKETVRRYRHDPADRYSVSANNTWYIFTDTSGFVFVTSNSSGLNYYNTSHHLATTRNSFRDETTRDVFDGYVNCITQHKDGSIWLGTQSRLIEWNRENNTARFHAFGQFNGSELNGREEVRALCFDTNDQLWIGLNRYGVVLLNKQRTPVKYYNKTNTDEDYRLPGNLVIDIKQSSQGEIWISTIGGLCRVNTVTGKVIRNDSILQQFAGKQCRNIWFPNETELWVGTNEGAWQLNILTGETKLLAMANGLSDNSITGFTGDRIGNIYIGTLNGLNVLHNDGKITQYNTRNGLRSNKCDALLTDKNGDIWIGNDNCLLLYRPHDSNFVAYDVGVGLSIDGYRTFSAFQTHGGELLWGSERGVSYFYPGQLKDLQLPLKVSILNISAADSSYWMPASLQLSLPWTKNTLNFSFSALDLYGNKSIIYQYMLQGVDENWKTTHTHKEVTYGKLSSGRYTFLVRASRNGRDWTSATSTVTIIIQTPWWRSTWFILLASLIITGIFAYVFYIREKKTREQQAQLEIEKAISYFASSISEKQTIDDILWNVTKNCISHLGFEDCVIYLLDQEKNVLVQRAAWGPKTTEENKIQNPLEIPLGKGVVGSVAISGRAEIINDTSIDKRYIVDDARRFSEICVPMIYNEKVVGIIDSEHSRKNFFTQRHLSILTTIASLCANKIARVRAEMASQKTQLELIDNQRRVAEAMLQSLRLQMNPHFIFNSLNSITQLVISNQNEKAYEYLQKFSKLMRTVLDASEQNFISVKEEVQMLNLYLELESLRFGSSFAYHIRVESSIDEEDTLLPSFILQPVVENAVWHGLLHKEGERRLSIDFHKNGEQKITCTITDNGIGVKAAKEMKKERLNGNIQHSKGLTAVHERLVLLEQQHHVSTMLKMEDLQDESGTAGGTKVILELPVVYAS